MQEWLNLHSYQRNTSDDVWYLNLAQKLFAQFESSVHLKTLSIDLKKRLSLSLSLYLEDAVSEGGGWNRFKTELKNLYDKELPFYSLDESYVSDEINNKDIAFLVWSVLSLQTDENGEHIFIDPLSSEIMEISNELYQQLDLVFEEAPITDALTKDWVMPIEQLKVKNRPLPSVDVKECKSESAKKFLVYTQGEPLQFFESYDSLKRFFVEVLEWDDKPESLMPEMEIFSNFILFANSKGLLMAPDAAPYFNVLHNPLFDKVQAEDEGYILFCESGACPFDLLKYGMQNHMLDDIKFPVANGRKLFEDNWDFIARWYLGEFYEGE